MREEELIPDVPKGRVGVRITKEGMKQIKRGTVVSLRSNAKAVVYSVRWGADDEVQLELGFVPGFLSRFTVNSNGKCSYNDFFSITHVFSDKFDFVELPPKPSPELSPEKKPFWKFWE